MTSAKKHMNFIKLISKTDKKQRDALFKTMTNDQVEFLRQVTRNMLEGVLVIKTSSIKVLKKYAKRLRDFADSKVKGRKILCLRLKKIWPYIISAVLPQLELLS